MSDRDWWPPGFDLPAFRLKRQSYGLHTGGDYVRGSSTVTLPHTALRYQSVDQKSLDTGGQALLFVRPFDYNTTEIYWSWPKLLLGEWIEVALVRSSFGAPATPRDGQTVWRSTRSDFDENILGQKETDLTAPPVVYDQPLPSGRWYYYTLFFRSDPVNWVAGMSDAVLLPRDYKHREHMWDAVPPYYQWLDNQYRSDNGFLRQFLSVFGFELDNTREFVESVLNMYMVDWTPISLLKQLGANFGVPYESGIGEIRYRGLVCYIPEGAESRGTSLGLEGMVEAVSKYECTVTPSNNLLLLPDDSDFYTGTGNWGGVYPTVNPTTILGINYLPWNKVYVIQDNNSYPPTVGRKSMKVYTSKLDELAEVVIACGDTRVAVNPVPSINLLTGGDMSLPPVGGVAGGWSLAAPAGTVATIQPITVQRVTTTLTPDQQANLYQNVISILPNQAYSFQADVKGTTGGGSFSLAVLFYDKDNIPLGSVVKPVGLIPSFVDQWLDFTTPANTTHMTVQFRLTGEATGATMDIDNAILTAYRDIIPLNGAVPVTEGRAYGFNVQVRVSDLGVIVDPILVWIDETGQPRAIVDVDGSPLIGTTNTNWKDYTVTGVAKVSVPETPAYLDTSVGYSSSIQPLDQYGDPVDGSFVLTAKFSVPTPLPSRIIFAEWNGGPTQRSWAWGIINGKLTYEYSTDGTQTVQINVATLDDLLALGDGPYTLGIRVQKNLDMSSRVAALYYDEGAHTWSEFGLPVSGLPLPNHFASSGSSLSVGDRYSRTGKNLYWTEIRTGQDPTAGYLSARFDPGEWTTGTSWTDVRGRLWALSISGCVHAKVAAQPGARYAVPMLHIGSRKAGTDPNFSTPIYVSAVMFYALGGDDTDVSVIPPDYYIKLGISADLMGDPSLPAAPTDMGDHRMGTPRPT